MSEKISFYIKPIYAPIVFILAATMLFALLGFLGIFPIGRGIMVFPISLQDIFWLSLEGALIGTGLALVEIPFLGSLIEHRLKWFLATILGCIVGWIVGGYFGSLLMEVGANLLGVGGFLSAVGFSISIGAFVGVFQSLYLGLPKIRKMLWILIVSVGWTVAWFSVVSSNLLYRSDVRLVSILNSALFGLVFSLFITVFAVKAVVDRSSQAAER